MRMILLAAAAFGFCQPALAQISTEGTWTGTCERPGYRVARLSITLRGGSGTISAPLVSTGEWQAAPIQGLRTNAAERTIRFSYVSLSRRVERTFVGAWSADFSTVSGTLSQADGQSTSCVLRRAG